MQTDIIVHNEYVLRFIKTWYSMILSEEISVQDTELDLSKLKQVFKALDTALENDAMIHLDFSRRKPRTYKVIHTPALAQFYSNVAQLDLYYQKAFRLDHVDAIKQKDGFKQLKALMGNVMSNALDVMRSNALQRVGG